MDEPTFLRNMEMASRGLFFCVGAGNHRFQMAYVDDVADACVRAARIKGIDGEAFNIGAEHTLPFRQQMEKIAEHLKMKPSIRSVPIWVFKSLMRVLIPLGLSPLEPDHLHLLYSDFVMDVTKARKLLGWEPSRTDLEMLIETYDWYRNATDVRHTKL
jgi:nucleoside-diphosphate-sugar epimerase